MFQLKDDAFLIYPFESLEYISEERLVVLLKKKRLVICGKQLQIDYYHPQQIAGSGHIEAVQFLDIG